MVGLTRIWCNGYLQGGGRGLTIHHNSISLAHMCITQMGLTDKSTSSHFKGASQTSTTVITPPPHTHTHSHTCTHTAVQVNTYIVAALSLHSLAPSNMTLVW